MLTTIPRQADRVPFVERLAEFGGRPALLHGDGVVTDGVVTYAQLADRVAHVTEALGEERRLVLVSGANGVDAVVAYLGALSGGHAVLLAPDDPRAQDRLDHAYSPDVTMTGADGWQPSWRRDEPRHDLHPELALVLSTSGSTGSPKAVRLSAQNLSANAESIATYLGITEADRAITSLPMHYCYGLSVLHSHLVRGASLVLTDGSVVDPCFWDAVERHGVTSFAGVPHTFDLLDRVGFEHRRIPGLRCVTQAGGRLAPEKVRRYAELGRRDGWHLFVMYGQTEATARMAYLPPELAAEHPSAIGRPVPGGSFELRPVETASGPDEGELVYRGPNVMLGYAHSPADLALGRTVDELRTGDLARRTADGLYEIVGRTSRFAKLFGLRIDLDGIEHRLADLGIAACCDAVDERVLVSVGRTRAGSASTQEAVRSIVADYLSVPPSSIVVVELEELPRLPSGKPDLRTARDRALAALDRERPSSTGDERDAVAVLVPQDVRRLMARVVGVAHVDDADTFVSLGGDSLSYVEMSLGLERMLGRLPTSWPTMSVSELERLTPRRSVLRHVETDVVLRATSISLVVASHAALFRVRGGAHVLLAVAGFNFARFRLGATDGTSGTADTARSIARIALPAVAWLGLLAVLTAEYDWPSLALASTYLGPRSWNPAWRYWFIEALVQTLVVLAVCFAVPAVRRFERRRSFELAAGLSLALLVLRFDLVTLGTTPEPLLAPHRVAWLFALGWAAQRADSHARRALVSLIAAAAVPGFFDEPLRDAVVLVGLLLLVWVRTIPVPRQAVRVIGVLAASSLYIYLTHFQVYLPMLERGWSPLSSVVASIAVGIAVSTVVMWLTRRRRQVSGVRVDSSSEPLSL